MLPEGHSQEGSWVQGSRRVHSAALDLPCEELPAWQRPCVDVLVGMAAAFV
jgi:hypothetical protein